jgi:hypothetical protein
VAGNVTVNFEDAYVLADAPWDCGSLPADEVYLTLHFNAMVTKDLTYGDYITDEAFVLQLPDGTSISPASVPFEILKKKDVTVSELWVSFSLPAPASGEYSLEVREYGGAGFGTRAKAQFPFTLPSFPAFGEK